MNQLKSPKTARKSDNRVNFTQRMVSAEKKSPGVYNITDRNELHILLNKFRFKTMIEIGVASGEYAALMLEKWKGFEHYYGIDAWENQKNYKVPANLDNEGHNKNYEITRNKLESKYGKERITLIRNYSTLAATLFKKESIDFIYVDGRHDYCGCAEDLNIYFPILICDGLFAGHDFMLKNDNPEIDWNTCANGTRVVGSVKKAVLDFAKKKSVRQVYTTGETAYASWYFFKDCN
jgi:predicted O-methyltransferase YrrM